MLAQETSHPQSSFLVALAISLILHGLILFVNRQSPESLGRPAQRIEASLVMRADTPKPETPVLVTPAKPSSVKPSTRKKILAVNKAKTRQPKASKAQWSVAEREEMNKFLRELGSPDKAAPDTAQRAMAMAREYGREQARQDETGEATLERLPNSPPVDPFSLEMYLDALVKKLNRSAGYVRNDPRGNGVKSALVQVKINPDGSLRSFKVLNAGDQQAEISFIKSVVEQAVPFSAFPPDMRRSARALGMMICIMPPSLSGGFGFSRSSDGTKC